MRTIPDVKNQWSPRLGISWAPDAKTAVRLAIGRYWSRTPGILLAQLFTSNGLQGVQYTSITNTTGQDPTDPNCRVGTVSCYDPRAPGWGANWGPQGVERINLIQHSGRNAGSARLRDRPQLHEPPHRPHHARLRARDLGPDERGDLDSPTPRPTTSSASLDLNRVYDGTYSANGTAALQLRSPEPVLLDDHGIRLRRAVEVLRLDARLEPALRRQLQLRTSRRT